MFIRIVCLCLILISVGGCEKSSQKEEQKPLIVIISPDNPPFEFKETAQGGDQVVGFDVDVVKK
jgi:ABC-type amino acid transport substrate-binding protein